MQEFKKTIDRQITISSPLKGVEGTEWVLRLGPKGLQAKPKGEMWAGRYLSWSGIIGLLLVYSK
jgi:hypothetical protein